MLVKLIVTLAQRFRQIYDSDETGLETKHHILFLKVMYTVGSPYCNTLPVPECTPCPPVGRVDGEDFLFSIDSIGWEPCPSGTL